MVDNIWSNRFLQRGTEPAWHCKGMLVGQQNLTANMALDMTGDYEVEKRPLTVELPDGSQLATEYSVIVRHPTKDDPQFQVFGSPVSNDYELIGPREACTIWDRAVVDQDGKTASVETFGVLRKGRELFISTEIANGSVKGDEVKSFLVLDSPMYSNDAAVIVVTFVRPVCQNTLTLGIKKAISKKVIPHIEGAKGEMEKWLTEMYQSAMGIVRIAESDFEAMANKHIRSKEASSILGSVFPDPMQPLEEWHNQFGLTFDQHLERYDQKLSLVKETRQTVMGLFGGDGVAMDTPAVKDTVWGLYNAVAEYSDNRRGPAESRATSVVFGERAADVKRAYNICLDFCKS